MPKPPTPVSWSTDTNINDPGEPWDGFPTKSAPPSGLQASGWKPTEKPPADIENYLQNENSAWNNYSDLRFETGGNEELVYEVPPLRTIRIAPTHFQPDLYLLTISGNSVWLPAWRIQTIPYGSSPISDIDQGIAFLPVSEFLVTGAVLEEVRVAVTPGAARVAPNNMSAALTGAGGPFTDDDDGTANPQDLILTGVGYTVDRSTDIIEVQLNAGNDGGVHVSDLFRWMEIDFIDPGPRNF
jgi:hypothetical protein